MKGYKSVTGTKCGSRAFCYKAKNCPTMSNDWKTYRQSLRDITKTFKSMSDKDFKFPEKPTE